MHLLFKHYSKMNSTLFTTNNTTIDEFGRDLSLRKSAEDREYERWISDLHKKMKTMSWAEIEWEEEEEEERRLEEQKRKEQKIEKEKFAAVAAKRKALLAQGNYDLEEGEVLE
jgi:hypothetical protein